MSSSAGRRRGTVALLFAVGVAAGSPGPCLAESEAATTALSVLAAAKHYYDKADYDRAAELFHEAYRIDPRPEFLFNAARVEHLGMKLAAAETHYVACLALTGADAQVRDRAGRYLEQVRRTRAAIEAARKEGKGDRLSPAQGVADGKGEPAGEAGPAVAALEGMKGVEAAAGVSARPAAKPTAPVMATTAPQTGWRRPAGWAAGGLGAALVAGGGIWFALAYADGAALADDARGCTVANPCAGDRAAIVAANRDEKLAGVVVGAGVALVGAGVWLLLGAEAERAAVAVELAPRGVLLSWRFGAPAVRGGGVR